MAEDRFEVSLQHLALTEGLMLWVALRWHPPCLIVRLRSWDSAVPHRGVNKCDRNAVRCGLSSVLTIPRPLEGFI